MSGLSACGSDNGPSAAAGDAVSKTPVTVTAANAAVTEKLVYRMTGVSGALRAENAVVLIPAGTPPAGGWPVLAWGHGARGIADQCAPSASADLGGRASYVNALLGNGYAVVAADYEGLGTPGLHPFLNLESAAQSILQAVTAATRAYPVLSKRVALLGHSQGGHAVLGAAQFAASVAPSLTIVGTVALAPASNVRAQADQLLVGVINNDEQGLGLRIAAGKARVAYTAMILAGVQAGKSSFNYAGALGVNAVALGIEALAKSRCLDELLDEVTIPVQTALGVSGDIEDLIPASTADLPDVDAYLSALEPGGALLPHPVLLIQGELDTTVLASSSQALKTKMEALGTVVSLKEYPGDEHESVVLNSLPEVVNFLRDRFTAVSP